MGKTLRISALLLIIGPFSAMFAEPFFEAVFDRLEIDTEEWAGPAVTALAQIFASDLFRIFAIGATGFGVGVWAHWLVLSFEKKPIAKKNDDLVGFSPDIEQIDTGDKKEKTDLNWNFERYDDFYFVGMSESDDKIFVHHFQGRGCNNTGEPITNFKGYVRSDRSGKTFATLYNLLGTLYAESELEPIPINAGIDTVTPFNSDRTPLPLQIFLDEIAPITFIFEYNGKRYTRQFSMEKFERSVEKYKKTVLKSKIKPIAMSAKK